MIWKSKPYRTATIHWHKLWVNAGRKCDDWLYDTMIMKRDEYHIAVKICIENYYKLKATTAIENAKKNDSCLIRELKKLMVWTGTISQRRLMDALVNRRL